MRKFNVVTLQIIHGHQLLHVVEDEVNLLVDFMFRNTSWRMIGRLKLESIRDGHERVDEGVAHLCDSYRVNLGNLIFVNRDVSRFNQQVHGFLDVRLEHPFAHQANVAESHDSSRLYVGRQLLVSQHAEQKWHNLLKMLVKAFLHVAAQILHEACRQSLALHVELVVLDRLGYHLNDGIGTNVLCGHRMQ